MVNLSLSENPSNVFWVFYDSTSRLGSFAFEVLFALSCEGKQPGRLLFMHHNTEAPPLVCLAGDQGDFDMYCPITFLPRSHCSSSSSIMMLHRRYEVQLFIVLSFVGVRSIYQKSFLWAV